MMIPAYSERMEIPGDLHSIPQTFNLLNSGNQLWCQSAACLAQLQ